MLLQTFSCLRTLFSALARPSTLSWSSTAYSCIIGRNQGVVNSQNRILKNEYKKAMTLIARAWSELDKEKENLEILEYPVPMQLTTTTSSATRLFAWVLPRRRLLDFAWIRLSICLCETKSLLRTGDRVSRSSGAGRVYAQ